MGIIIWIGCSAALIGSFFLGWIAGSVYDGFDDIENKTPNK